MLKINNAFYRKSIFKLFTFLNPTNILNCMLKAEYFSELKYLKFSRVEHSGRAAEVSHTILAHHYSAFQKL